MEQESHDDVVESMGFSGAPSERVRRIARCAGNAVAAAAAVLLVMRPISLVHEPPETTHISSNENSSLGDVSVSAQQLPASGEIAPPQPYLQHWGEGPSSILPIPDNGIAAHA